MAISSPPGYRAEILVLSRGAPDSGLRINYIYLYSVLGLSIIFFRAYSIGAGTYTGIEAVSNGLPIPREPRTVTTDENGSRR